MDIILKLLPSQVVQGWIVTGLLFVIGWVWVRTQTAIKNSHLSDNQKSTLEDIGGCVDLIANAEAKLSGGKPVTAAQLPAMEAQAEAIAKAQWPKIEKDLEGDLSDIVHHLMAAKTLNHAMLAPAAAVALQLDPRMATMNLPADKLSTTSAPDGRGGLVGLLLLPALLGLALAGLLAASGLAKGESLPLAGGVKPAPELVAGASFLDGFEPIPVTYVISDLGVGRIAPAAAVLPPDLALAGGGDGVQGARAAAADIVPNVPDKWQWSALTPGIRFNLTGKAPAAIAAGSGIQGSYLFNKLQVTLPNASLPSPVFGVSVYLQGSFNFTTLVEESEAATVGVGLILFNQITLAFGVDLIAGGSAGANGLFTSNMSLANLAPQIFYSLAIN